MLLTTLDDKMVPLQMMGKVIILGRVSFITNTPIINSLNWPVTKMCKLCCYLFKNIK